LKSNEVRKRRSEEECDKGVRSEERRAESVEREKEERRA
jgi:hypothetical protein